MPEAVPTLRAVCATRLSEVSGNISERVGVSEVATKALRAVFHNGSHHFTSFDPNGAVSLAEDVPSLFDYKILLCILNNIVTFTSISLNLCVSLECHPASRMGFERLSLMPGGLCRAVMIARLRPRLVVKLKRDRSRD